MAGTYTNLLFHLVFSTKHRFPFIVNADFAADLYRYLGAAAKGHGVSALGIGGMPDHVHMLVRWDPGLRLVDFMREIKSGSTKWVRRNYPDDPDLCKFVWQEGYGAFTVSESSRDAVLAYIANQHEHHRKSSFQAEFRGLLVRNKIPYDEETIWL